MSAPDDPDGTDGTDGGHWFEELADHMGPAYLRYSFTRGTENEVAFLVDALALAPGMRVLDVGCGPGRHAYALAERGIEVLGVDISQEFIDVARRGAPPGATFERLDARAMAFDGEFDAAISLCQGAFGLSGGGHLGQAVVEPGADGPPTPSGRLDVDLPVLAGMARALRPGGRLACSAFSAYFQVRFLEDTDTFDAATGVNHERTEIRNEAGDTREVSLWTSCFTPRELRLMVASVRLQVDAIHGVTPGAYRADPPSIDVPEFLVLATHPT